jgi:transcription initiation factor TFIIIB Brf1 subunit/transcription initiation factor TFIIB
MNCPECGSDQIEGPDEDGLYTCVECGTQFTDNLVGYFDYEEDEE